MRSPTSLPLRRLLSPFGSPWARRCLHILMVGSHRTSGAVDGLRLRRCTQPPAQPREPPSDGGPVLAGYRVMTALGRLQNFHEQMGAIAWCVSRALYLLPHCCLVYSSGGGDDADATA